MHARPIKPCRVEFCSQNFWTDTPQRNGRDAGAGPTAGPVADFSGASSQEQVVVEGATMTGGVLLIRDPTCSWMIIVKYTARDKFLAFGGLNRKIDDFMARKPMSL